MKRTNEYFSQTGRNYAKSKLRGRVMNATMLRCECMQRDNVGEVRLNVLVIKKANKQ